MQSATDVTPKFEIAHVLFMDIVAYSKMPTDQQARVLQELQQVVVGTREYGCASRGSEVVSIPTGDGIVLAFFGSPESPVRCALEIAECLLSHPRIKLRMGVNSGPVYRVRDIKDNINVAGAGINNAQRVMDCGDAGHILLSNTSADILKQHSEWTERIHELGVTEVKHGIQLRLFNLFTQELGNPVVPTKLGGATDGPAEKHEPVPSAVLPFQARFARTKAWYYLKGADDRNYILAFVNAKGSCSMRTFDAEVGRSLGKQYRAGNYEDQFADFIRNANELMVNSQPNLERDCKERLPDAVLSSLKKQIKPE